MLLMLRFVLVPLTILFTSFPFILGVLCVMIIGGPFIALAGYLVTLPIAMVRLHLQGSYLQQSVCISCCDALIHAKPAGRSG